MDSASPRSVLWLALYFAAFVLGVASFSPPRPLPATAPPSEFSAERAMVHIEALSASPRMIGMPGHASARAYITRELSAHGWEVTESLGVQSYAFWHGQVVNLVAELPGAGAGAGPAVLLVSHYDSVPTGPGAGDAASGVGAILEVARILSLDPPPHPVRLLLTDGEELGLLGARHFVSTGGLVGVGAVVNLEARGGSGAALLFESHENNSGFIDAFSSVPAPVGSSLGYEVYRRMPNDTDFSIFRDAGVAGLNLAFLDDFHRYHSALDTAAALDVRSVQHHGGTLLVLSRELGDVLDLTGSVTSVYFPLPGRLLARYPYAWSAPLAILVALLLVLSVSRAGLSLGGLVRGLGWSLLSVLSSSAVGLVAGLLLWWQLPELSEMRFPLPYRPGLWVAGLSLLSGAAAAQVLWLGRGADLRGSVLLWLFLAVLTALLFPGGSYLFLWPVLAAGVGLCLGGLASLGAVLGWFLMGPLLGLLFTALGLPESAPVGLLIGLLLSLSVTPLSTELRRWLGPALLALSLLVLSVAWMRSGTDSAHPRHEGRVYWRDGDSGEARLYTWRPDVSGEELLDHPLFWERVTASSQSVSPDGASTPQVSSTRSDAPGGRLVELSVQTSSPASLLRLVFLDPGRVHELSVMGVSVASSGDGLVYFGDLSAGVSVALSVTGEAPLPVRIETTAFSLPAEAGRPSADRISTPWMMGVSDATVTSDVFRF